ncbi:HlyD family efflux transporter periplasmic adaptor subunit [Aureispira sp. CCB-E]|uniref:HlyD family efflux transporter periplasmic adaptor subunit n=1 Tax=Aureispira sp. CCB-E TaxID=3051121 RepID=UPI002868946C|nr:HlyD family efflux transporter periplasmic adaptor subunit [Aureispira sp. CCB-E]WMX14206.1 HlyD family efflux transporter periplasmic adaptor subunit [Aureispira sp. CCB-E]
MAIDKDKIIRIEDKSYFFQDILEKTPSWIVRWGNTVFFVVFFLLILGLWLIEYPDVIVSEAKVLTENPSIEVYSESSGQIAYILEKDKTKVQKGAWILILNNSADYKSILKLMELTQKLEGGTFWEQIEQIRLDDQLRLGNLNDEYLNLFRNISEYQLFQKLNPQFQQIGINKNRTKNLDEILLNLERQKRLLEQELKLVRGDYERMQLLFEDKAVAKIEVEQKEMQWLALKSQVEELNSSILNAQLQQQVISKENSSLVIEQSDRYLQLRNNILSSYNRLLFLLKEWEQKNVLSAPVEGILNMYDIRSKRQFLAQEQHVFTISPIGKQTYYAWVKMPIANSGKVKIKQEVLIKLLNYPHREFGTLKGHILSITSVPKDGNYLLKVALPQQLKTSANIELEAKQELIGTAEVITEKLSLLRRIFNFLDLN